MKRRLPGLLLLTLLGFGGLAACGGSSHTDTEFGKAPSGLPADIAFNLGVYDHAKRASTLPHGVESVGATRDHGIMYAPKSGPGHPRSVWVTKGGRTWKYTFDFAMSSH
jgi:hypothetical protein